MVHATGFCLGSIQFDCRLEIFVVFQFFCSFLCAKDALDRYGLSRFVCKLLYCSKVAHVKTVDILQLP
jgi:hypothetical protein